ncbi:MAG: hypothetical protein QM761_14370 [Pseudoxanthomonas sp.]
MDKISACRATATTYLCCAAAFIAIGIRQPAFLGVGMAFLGLGIALLRRKSAP